MKEQEVARRLGVAQFRTDELEPTQQARPAPTPSEVIAHDLVGDAEQPGSLHIRTRHLVDPSPGNGEYLGGSILGVDRAEAPQAIAVDRVEMRLEEGIERALTTIQSLGLHVKRYVPGSLCPLTQSCTIRRTHQNGGRLPDTA